MDKADLPKIEVLHFCIEFNYVTKKAINNDEDALWFCKALITNNILQKHQGKIVKWYKPTKTGIKVRCKPIKTIEECEEVGKEIKEYMDYIDKIDSQKIIDFIRRVKIDNNEK